MFGKYHFQKYFLFSPVNEEKSILIIFKSKEIKIRANSNLSNRYHYQKVRKASVFVIMLDASKAFRQTTFLVVISKTCIYKCFISHC